MYGTVSMLISQLDSDVVSHTPIVGILFHENICAHGNRIPIGIQPMLLLEVKILPIVTSDSQQIIFHVNNPYRKS